MFILIPLFLYRKDRQFRMVMKKMLIFRKKRIKKTRPIISLPLEQIIQQQKQQPVSCKSCGANQHQEDNQPQKERLLALKTNFDFDKSDVKKSELQKLSQKLSELKKADLIEIKGYTDKTGAEEYNDKLALKRAESVKQYLISQGIEETKIKIEAKGKCCYISPKDSENRRVEIWVEIENGGLHISQ
ncbi:hypothetical protein A45J_0002 [hot springs metagenome]|uniref:OmpA-like domain-containing protein n=1 Tax=hot springs metagenome TaxID=433727 RepID=A0A5J4L0J6_9ZZZZ